MTAIVSVDFDWSIESCDKAPRDLDYERNTEKYGRAMKLTWDIGILLFYRNVYLYLRSRNEMRPKAAFRCGWNRRPIHWTSEKLSALFDVIYTVSHG